MSGFRSKKSRRVTSGVLLSLANYTDLVHFQVVGARHAVPGFQRQGTSRASVEGTTVVGTGNQENLFHTTKMNH